MRSSNSTCLVAALAAMAGLIGCGAGEGGISVHDAVGNAGYAPAAGGGQGAAAGSSLGSKAAAGESAAGSGTAGGGAARGAGGATGTGGIGDKTESNGPAGTATSGAGGSAEGATTGPRGGTMGPGAAGAGGTSRARGTGGGGAAGTTRGAGGANTAGSGQRAAGGSTSRPAGTGGSAATGAAGAAGTATEPSEWPQCYATDTVPADDAALKQRAAASDYKTQVAFGGVAMLIGANRQACLTDEVASFDVKDLHAEIRDVVEGLGFPGFLDWKRGYYMNWVILNSGIPGATLSGQGGHQGDRYGHMNFESTEECPCNWGTGDSSNRGNALHESIHALQAELWAFNNQASGWVHEAHNCYLGTQRTHVVYDKYTMGYGAAATLQMPHVPIESMGLNTDDSIAGPADQKAKTYVNSIVRYGLEIFFLSLNLEMGRGFVNCLWIDGSKAGKPDQRVSSTKSVFQMLQSYAGAEGAAHAVMSFGARSSILDFEGWTAVVRTTLKSNWNDKYWFYTFPTGDGTTTFRPPTKQIPHHQGRNIIPIQVASGATSVTVEVTPDASGDLGTAEHLQAQLAYRTSDDRPVYGAVFSSGQNTLEIPDGARNGIVNLVIAVTNPNAASGGDDGSNKGFDAQEHFSYQARIVSGGKVAPTSTRPW